MPCSVLTSGLARDSDKFKRSKFKRLMFKFKFKFKRLKLNAAPGAKFGDTGSHKNFDFSC